MVTPAPPDLRPSAETPGVLKREPADGRRPGGTSAGCLESCTKNQRAGRCPKYSKRAIIRPAVTGHNLMKTIVREHLRPLVELVRQSNPGKHSIGRRGCATGQPLQASLNHQRQPSALCLWHNPLSFLIKAHCTKVSRSAAQLIRTLNDGKHCIGWVLPGIFPPSPHASHPPFPPAIFLTAL